MPLTPGGRARAAYAGACAAAAAALLLAYSNHFQNAFHFDDAHTVEQNLYLRDLGNLPLFFRDARTFSALPANQSYRPVVTTTLALDHALGGLRPLPFHLDQFAVLLGTCALLLLLFRRLLDLAGPHPRNRWLALLGASIFGLHGALGETVNYVIARSDMLSTLGVVLSLWIFAARRRGRRLQLHLLPAVAGVLAKEQGAMAAPILFLYAALFEQRVALRELLRPRVAWAALRPVLSAFAACGAALLLALRMAPSWSPGGASRWQYAWTQPFVLLRYLWLFVCPTRLSADSDWRVFPSPADLRVAVGLAGILLLAWVAVRASRAAPTRPAAFGIGWFFLALAPTSSLVPLAEVTNDHRLYFPFVGLSLAVAGALQAGLAWRAARGRAPMRAPLVAASLLLLLAHGVFVHHRNEVWRSEESLWRDVTQASPRNGRGWMNYGLALMRRGDYAGAERSFEQALALAPGYGYAHVNMGIVQAALGHPGRAEREFRAGIALQPDAPILRYFYARWLDQVGRDGEAIPLLERVAAEAPADPRALALLATIRSRAPPAASGPTGPARTDPPPPR